MTLKIKRCSKCKKEKYITEFGKNKNTSDKLQPWCKSCMKEYRDNHKEYFRTYRAQYYKNNKDYYKNKHDEYYNSEDGYKRCWINATLTQHRNQGCNINITNDELFNYIKDAHNCNYCGIELKWNGGEGLTPNSPTLDRINNELDININNIQILCINCNTRKHNQPHDEFILYCKKIAEKFR